MRDEEARFEAPLMLIDFGMAIDKGILPPEILFSGKSHTSGASSVINLFVKST